MNKPPLNVVFAGTPDFAKVALQALIDHQAALNINIVAVYTQPDRKAGRGQKLTASPVKELALAHHIPVEQPISFSLKHEHGKVSRETLANYRPDVMIVAAYGLILPLGVHIFFNTCTTFASVYPHQGFTLDDTHNQNITRINQMGVF